MPGGVRVGFLLEQLLAPVPGGTGRYAAEMAKALVSTAPPGADIRGWTAWHPDVSAARLSGVIGPNRLPLGRRALAVAWERGLGPAPRAVDLVHAPTLLVPPRGRRPLVVTIHDAVPWTHPETLTPRGVAFHQRMGERAARDADLVVVPTEAVRRELTGRLPLGDRARVIGLGASAALAAPPADADERARRLALPADGYLLTLATLEPRKGLDVAIAALAEPGAPPLPLLVVGAPGWGGVDPAASAARLGLAARRVRVLGRLADPDLAVVLHRATALVVPSRAEGFGLPLLEAMAAGTPVVTSDVPALVEVAGGAAVVVPVGDPAALAAALAEIAFDPVRRGRLSAAGRVRAAAFTWSGAARALWSAYAPLLSGQRGRPGGGVG